MPSDKEMINNLIDSYTGLQRIKKHKIRKKNWIISLRLLRQSWNLSE